MLIRAYLIASWKERVLAMVMLFCAVGVLGAILYFALSSAASNDRLWEARATQDLEGGEALLVDADMDDAMRRAWPGVEALSYFPASTGFNAGNSLFLEPVMAGFVCLRFDDGHVELTPYRYDDMVGEPRHIGGLIDEVRDFFDAHPDKRARLKTVCEDHLAD